MSLRPTLVLLAIAVALGAYLWLYELPRERAAEESEAAARRILALEPDEVTALELPLEDGRTARLERGDAGPTTWRLSAPLDFPCDDRAVESLLSLLAGLEREAEVADPPEELGRFGFREPAKRVRVWSGEGEPHELRLGGEAPVGSARYVVREGALFTAAKSQVDRLEPALRALRDKRVARLDPDAIDAVRVEAGELVVAAERSAAVTADAGGTPAASGAGWRLVEPRPLEADGPRIRRLVEDVSLARASGFLDADVDPLETGLAAPEVELTLSAGGEVERIAFGRAAGKAFARVEGRPVVYEVPLRVLDGVPRQLFGYREKRVIDVDVDRVSRIELNFPREARAFAFVRGEEGWSVEGGEVEVDRFRIEDVLYAVRELDASGLEEGEPDEADLGLEPPRVHVLLRDEAGAELGWLELGDPDPERGLAARSSRSERIWRVRNDLGEDLPLGLEAFETHWVEPPEAGAPAAQPPAPEPGG